MKLRTFFFASLLMLFITTMTAAVPDQPMMRAARADLQTARRELQRATPDKGGHRAKAIEIIDAAISEVNAGIEYDRRHDHAIVSGTPDQPHMQAALTALESARHNLEQATADKGGHRVKALDLVKDAISEVKKGIEAGR